MIKLGKFSRSVSIIGVGCTPFMDIITNPEMQGLTEGELFGYAAIEAMKDGGITPKHLQSYFHAQACPYVISDYSNANVHVNDWFGARGLGSISHSEACCSGYFALDLAAQAVASGKCDFVLTGGVDMGLDKAVDNMPAHFRERLHTSGFSRNVKSSYDRGIHQIRFQGRRVYPV